MRSDDSAVGGGTDRYRRQRRIQEATYAIAQAVTSSEGLDDLFARIHRIVAGLMEARNLYIALLDDATGSLTFPYFRDEIDAEPPAGPVPVGRGLTGYVLRKGEPLLASPEVFDALVAQRRGGVDRGRLDRLAGRAAPGRRADDRGPRGPELRREPEVRRGGPGAPRLRLLAGGARHRAPPGGGGAPPERDGGTAPSSRRCPTSSSSSGGTAATRRSTPRARRRSPRRARPSSAPRSPRSSRPRRPRSGWRRSAAASTEAAPRSSSTRSTSRPGRRVFEGRIVRARRGLGPLPRPRRHRARRVGAGPPRAGARAEASHRQHARRHLRDGPHRGPAVRDALLRGGDGLVAGGVHRPLRLRVHPPRGRRARPGDARAEDAARRLTPSFTYRFRTKDGRLALGRLPRDARAGRERGAGRARHHEPRRHRPQARRGDRARSSTRRSGASSGARGSTRSSRGSARASRTSSTSRPSGSG